MLLVGLHDGMGKVSDTKHSENGGRWDPRAGPLSAENTRGPNVSDPLPCEFGTGSDDTGVGLRFSQGQYVRIATLAARVWNHPLSTEQGGGVAQWPTERMHRDKYRH